MRVYKFIDKEWALVALREKRLKIARLTGLNDPFELLPFAAPTGRVHRLSLAMTLAELNEGKGWICFSRKWSNPIIWAHYAEQHHGLCLGFDVPDEFCTAVRYVEEREPFPDFDALTEPEKLAAVNRMLFTKFNQWGYEDEIRVPVRLDPSTETERGHYFQDFDDNLRLVEIIVGIRSATCRREIELALGGAEGVEIIKAESSIDRFAIVPSRHPLRNHDDLVYCIVRGRMLHPVEFVYHPDFAAWTPEQQRIVAEIRRVADALQTDTLSQDQFDEHHQLGGVSTAGYQFGSWNAAVTAAGLKAYDGSRPREYSDEELLADIIRVHRQLSAPPSERKLASLGRYSLKPYKARWGSITKARDAAYKRFGDPEKAKPSE